MQKDFTFAIAIGFLAALVWIPLFRYLNAPFSGAAEALALAAPVLFVVDLVVGRFLSRWKPFFYPFSKFTVVGFLGSGIDFGVFNFFIYATGIEHGWEIALFKSASFLTALSVSYCGNKFWTFASPSGGGASPREFSRYTLVTIFGLVMNVGITSFIINFIHPFFGMSQLLWNNAAAVAATVVNLMWNFAGYFLAVFAPPVVPAGETS